MNFAAIVKLLGDKELATQVVDNYISREMFFRGLILVCTHCSNVDWFSVDEITHTFTCKRCGKNQQYTKQSWKHPDEPSWFYKLDEIVYQALLNNSVAPILTTLAALGRNVRESFLFSPELRISLHGEHNERTFSKRLRYEISRIGIEAWRNKGGFQHIESSMGYGRATAQLSPLSAASLTFWCRS